MNNPTAEEEARALEAEFDEIEFLAWRDFGSEWDYSNSLAHLVLSEAIKHGANKNAYYTVDGEVNRLRYMDTTWGGDGTTIGGMNHE